MRAPDGGIIGVVAGVAVLVAIVLLLAFGRYF